MSDTPNLPGKLAQFKKQFSESAFWTKLMAFARQAGMKTVYSALLLFYAYKRPETPLWAKNIVIGALGYLISPIDWLPDLTPIIGFTDDVGVLSFGLVAVAAHINDGVREKARTQLRGWFGEQLNEDELSSVDDQY
jgi:uncharacterized membrane protein YkvA (DUF1232 family)